MSLSRRSKLRPQHQTPGLVPGVFVLGVGVLLWLLSAGFARADCAPTSALQRAQVDHVIDGDTLALRDGRHIRLIGINAPETGRRERAGEPLGGAAKTELARLLPAGSAIFLQPGSEALDHYGRVLAHAYQSVSAGNVEALLLQQGLAQQVLVPPNLTLADCLRSAEAGARKAGRGVWGERYFSVRDTRQLTAADAGFRRVRLTITAVRPDRSGWWLETDGHLVLRLERRHAAFFDGPPRDWIGQHWVVRGWIRDRSGDPAVKKRGFAPLVMALQHPGMVESGLH